MAPNKRGRTRSRSDATERSKSSGASGRRGKRDRAESGGDISVLSTGSLADAKQAVEEGKKVEATNDPNTDMDVEMEGQETTALTKPAPTIDVVVHRIRCLQYRPKAIITMKSTPTWCSHGLIAISRENGCVELKSIDEKLRTLAVVPGYHEQPATCLAWIKESSNDTTPRLVGGSRDGNIFMVNFSKKSFTNLTASGGGGVFVLESLSYMKGCENFVAAGCEDGSVRIFQYQKNGSCLLVSSIPSSGAPVLSLACQSGGASGKGLDGLTIFVAIADGTIRRFDCSGQNEKMTWKSVTRMTVESRGRNIPTRVWALRALQDGTLVSANSLGQVQFWDGATGSLEQSIEQTDTKADVLGLAVSTDESKVFASGVDSRVVCIERQIGADNPMWILTQARRPHTHDVKSLEICRKKTTHETTEGKNLVIDVLVTGGLDTKLSTLNVAQYHKQRPKVIYPWPTFSPVFVASKARIAGIMRENKVELYRLCQRQIISGPVTVPDRDMHIGTVEVRHASNMSCAAISNDGRYLAIANMASFYLFSLSFDKKERLRTKRLSLDMGLKSTVSAAKFIDSTTLALACVDGSIVTTSLEAHEGGSLVGGKIQRISGSSLSTNEFPVHCIVASPSGALVATQANSLAGGRVDLYADGEDGESRRLWTLPSLDTPVADITFLDEDRIAVACIDFSLVVFDIKEERLSKWNQDAETSSLSPPELKFRRDYPVRVFPHAGDPDKVLMGSFGSFVVFDLNKPFPTSCKTFPELHVRGKKRKRALSVSENAGESRKPESTTTVCLRYNSMLYMGFLDDGEMMIVEQPWISVLATLPAALSRRVYGT